MERKTALIIFYVAGNVEPKSVASRHGSLPADISSVVSAAHFRTHTHTRMSLYL